MDVVQLYMYKVKFVQLKLWICVDRKARFPAPNSAATMCKTPSTTQRTDGQTDRRRESN